MAARWQRERPSSEIHGQEERWERREKNGRIRAKGREEVGLLRNENMGWRMSSNKQPPSRGERIRM